MVYTHYQGVSKKRISALALLIIAGLFAFMASIGVFSNAKAASVITTDFESFSTGISVTGQSGWASSPQWDEEVVDIDGNNVWRVSNAVYSGSFGDMPYAPRPGGFAMTAIDPVGGNAQYFAGESSTGADNTSFYGKFNFKSATGAPQPGLRITVSADNGQGGRQSFISIEDNGLNGLDVSTYKVTPNGSFAGPIVIAKNLSYSGWHTVEVEIIFNDGPNNDIARYKVDGIKMHNGTSWEQYYSNNQASLHPMGVPVQTLLFRISSGASSDVLGKGLYIDEVVISVSSIGPVSKKDCTNPGWRNYGFENQGLCTQYVNTGKDSR